MASASNRTPKGPRMRLTVESAADAIILKMEEGYFFVTHEGEMVGPDQDKQEIIVKARLYLLSAGHQDD